MNITSTIEITSTEVDKGNTAAAGNTLVALWQHLFESDCAVRPVECMQLVGVTRTVAHIPELASRLSKVRPGFREVADDGEKGLKWIWLSAALGFDQEVADELSGLFQLSGGGVLWRFSDTETERILHRYARWSELGWLSRRPTELVALDYDNRDRMVQRLQAMAVPSVVSKQLEIEKTFRDHSARRYAACLSAGRGDEARAIAQCMLAHDDAAHAYLAMVSAALDAQMALADHREWLRIARSKGHDTQHLETRLEGALRQR